MEISDDYTLTVDKAEDEDFHFEWPGCDLSTVAVRFMVRGRPELNFTPDINPDDTTARIVAFSPAFAAALGNTARDYMIRVQFPDGKFKVAMRGKVQAIGWTE